MGKKNAKYICKPPFLAQKKSLLLSSACPLRSLGYRCILSFGSHSFFQRCLLKFILFIYFLAMLCGTPDLSSPTRDGTHASCSRNTDSEPLAHQGSPLENIL